MGSKSDIKKDFILTEEQEIQNRIVLYKKYRKIKKQRLMLICDDESTQTEIAFFLAKKNYSFIALSLSCFDISLLSENVYRASSADCIDIIIKEAVLGNLPYKPFEISVYSGFCLLLDLYEEKIEYEMSAYKIMSLNDDVKKHVYLYDILIYDNGFILKKYTNYLDRKSINELVIFYRQGLGDLFFDYNYMMEKIETALDKGVKTLLIVMSYTPAAKYISEILASTKVIKTEYPHEVYVNLEIIKEAKIFYEVKNDMIVHKDDKYLERLNGCKDYSDTLFNTAASYLDKKTKEKIDGMLNKGFTLGVQFYTSTLMEKNWHISHVREFMDLCKAHNLQTINISPTIYNGLYENDLGDCHIHEVIYAMKFVDVFVGIDSFGGHLAALYNKKSITIGLYDYLFKPLNNNISINTFSDGRPLDFTTHNWKYDLDAATVFDALKKAVPEIGG